MVVQYFIIFKDYLIEVLPFLAIGFLMSGLIYEFIPSKWVGRHLGREGINHSFTPLWLGQSFLSVVLAPCPWQ